MAIRRAGRMPASPIITSSTSRSLKHSHSVLPTSGLASSSIYHPRRAASVAPDTRVDDPYLFDRVSGASYLSNATLDDCDDTVRRSRGRDAQLLRDANNAIVSTELYATPQSSVISRRVMRGRSVPPRAVSVPPRPIIPVQQPPSDRKIIRTEDGYSKPKNLLSWQYRLDARTNPNDVCYEPASFGRIRASVADARYKMDKHRQLIDRYLPEEGDSPNVKERVLRKMHEMERRNPASRDIPPRPTVNCSKYYACGGDPANPPLSDLRRRIRRTLNKSRRNSSVN